MSWTIVLRGIIRRGTTARAREGARSSGGGFGGVLESISRLVAFWRPNSSRLTLVFSVPRYSQVIDKFCLGCRSAAIDKLLIPKGLWCDLLLLDVAMDQEQEVCRRALARFV